MYEQPALRFAQRAADAAVGGCGAALPRFRAQRRPACRGVAYRDFFGNHAHSVSVSAPHRRTDDRRAIAGRASRHVVQKTWPEVASCTFSPRTMLRNRDFLRVSQRQPLHSVQRTAAKLFWMARPAETEDVAAYVTRMVAWVRDQFDYEKARTNVHLEPRRHPQGRRRRVPGLRTSDDRAVAAGRRALALRLGLSRSADCASTCECVAWRAGEPRLARSRGYRGSDGPAFDPTHRYRTDERHIRVAVGRDYADVPPLKGSIAAVRRAR